MLYFCYNELSNWIWNYTTFIVVINDYVLLLIEGIICSNVVVVCSVQNKEKEKKPRQDFFCLALINQDFIFPYSNFVAHQYIQVSNWNTLTHYNLRETLEIYFSTHQLIRRCVSGTRKRVGKQRQVLGSLEQVQGRLWMLDNKATNPQMTHESLVSLKIT